MRLDCPNCHAIFEVPDERLLQVRKLRCSGCGKAWRNDRYVAGGIASNPALEDHPQDSGPKQDCSREAEQPGVSSGEQDVLDADASLAVKEMSGRASARRLSRAGGYSPSHAEVANPSDGDHDGGKGWLAGWCVSLASVSGAGFAIWHWRGAVAHAMSGFVR